MQELTGDPRKTIAFLKRLYPQGPWCLSAIAPDRKGMETKTFWPDDPVPDVGYDTSEEGCYQFLVGWLGKRNLYFHVNFVMALLQKKAEREDIKAVCYLHVDADPRNDPSVQSIEDQRSAILASFTTNRPKGVPAPTIIIDSGGGYQAFWRLTEALQINGDLGRAEDAKRYNQQLELLFGGDNCHNIDRLMRLPYTINIPNAQKAAKGRKPALTKLIEFNDSTYALNLFTQAVAVQTKHNLSTSGSANVVSISGNVKRVADLAELDEWSIPDRVKVIIAQGSHPDPEEVAKKTSKTGKAPSRSEWLFDVVCQLVRHDVPDAVIYSLITDPNWGISESVIELKGQAERYAIKQIVSAKEFTVDPVLAEFNDKYCVVGDVGGKVLVAWEDESELLPGIKEWKFKSLEEFQKEHEARKVQVGTDRDGNPKYQEAGKWWRKNEKRRQVDRMVFRPDKEDVPRAINLWRGFTVPAVAGDKHHGFKAHMLNNLCKGDQEHFIYLWNWLARVVQVPAEAGQVAVVLKGVRGAGKGFFVNTFGRLFGRHYVQASAPSHIVGQFNGHLRACCLLFADEAVFVGDKKTQGVLKAMITEPTIAIERKGIDAEMCPNFLHVIMASNDDHVIRAGTEERRYFVLDVSSEMMQKSEYFEAISKDMQDGGLSNLLHDLMTTDLSEFNVRAVPKTEALQHQADLSFKPEEAWLFDALMQGGFEGNRGEWKRMVPRSDLYDWCLEEMRNSHRNGFMEMTRIQFGFFLKRMINNGVELECKKLTIERVAATDQYGMQVMEKRQERCYILPDLATARANWEKATHRKVAWLEVDLGL